MAGKKSFLVKENNIPEKARFPVIDAHNHLWGSRELDRHVETMDAVGIVSYSDLTGNVIIKFVDGGYTIESGDISVFFESCEKSWPGRFYCFTMASFARDTKEPLFDDPQDFVTECIDTLQKHVEKGAKGLKILKELGLHHRDGNGELIHMDDPRFAPVWEEAGRLNIPVLIHTADPSGFFHPNEPENEHSETLTKYPSWSFADAIFPRKEELLERRDRLVRQHPDTTFILAHVANHSENLSYVSNLLDDNPNVYIDFSARLDELGRQPYTSRELFIRHQDRIIFGADMPANLDSSIDMYRTYFRFLETYDEAFYAPDYDGTFNRARWPICGIGLPDEVLEKIYYKNIVKIIPSLKETISKIQDGI